MKIQYKHQPFQEEAARCVAEAFQGQPKQNLGSNYLIDPGTNQGLFNTEGYTNAPLQMRDEVISQQDHSSEDAAAANSRQ